jgi:hypothetical protein
MQTNQGWILFHFQNPAMIPNSLVDYANVELNIGVLMHQKGMRWVFRLFPKIMVSIIPQIELFLQMSWKMTSDQ